MSYIRNCKKCGERISLREMEHGQWVAFEVNTDRPHKHAKGARKRNGSEAQSSMVRSNGPKPNEDSSSGPIIFVIAIIIIVLFFMFS